MGAVIGVAVATAVGTILAAVALHYIKVGLRRWIKGP